MKPSRNILYTFGINGSLRKREVQSLSPYTEHYLFNSAANLKAYSNNGLYFAYYGYDAANARTYKLSMLNLNQWVNGQPQPLQLQLQNAMFYPNAYLTFNSNGNYTKHYYNGTERICSRLGDQTFSLDCSASLTPQTQQRLGTRIMNVDQRARAELLEVVEAGDIPIETPSVDITSLQPANPNANSHSHSNTSNDIFYYHTNHLGSTAFVTDANATVTQGFLYAPFGEIISEYNAGFANGIIPNYTFNAKELDEETGMYYYEARYYNPPVFVSRDPHFERYFWTTPYGYCNNNPLKYVDPTGCEFGNPRSRIEYRGNGTFGINIANLNRATRNNFYKRNGDPSNWTDGIGINTTVYNISFNSSKSEAPSLAGVDSKDITTKTVSGRIAKSTGQPDKRDSHTLVTAASGGKARGFGTFAMAVDAINTAYNFWQIYSVYDDVTALSTQVRLLERAEAMVKKSNLVPPEYQNKDALGAIVNFVFQGQNATNDDNIAKIGTEILKTNNRYDKDANRGKPLIQGD